MLVLVLIRGAVFFTIWEQIGPRCRQVWKHTTLAIGTGELGIALAAVGENGVARIFSSLEGSMIATCITGSREAAIISTPAVSARALCHSILEEISTEYEKNRTYGMILRMNEDR
jgi:hypothetical protein